MTAPEIASTKLSIDVARLPGVGARVIDVGCGDGRHTYTTKYLVHDHRGLP